MYSTDFNYLSTGIPSGNVNYMIQKIGNQSRCQHCSGELTRLNRTQIERFICLLTLGILVRKKYKCSNCTRLHRVNMF